MKRLISFIIMSVIAITSFNTVIYADSSAEDEKDRYIGLFSDIGVFRSSFSETDRVTRAQYAQMLTYLMNKESALDSMRGVSYSDVPEDYILSREINLMNAMGIITAKEGDKFCPEDSLTLDEAVCGLVRVLGYTIVAENYGGYPTGYNKVANSFNMLRGVKGEWMTPYVTAGAVARMFYNVLDTDIIDYGIGKTLFKALGLNRGSGKVTAVYGLSMLDGKTVHQNEIMVGGEKYNTTVNDAMKYFGSDVEYYYRDDENGLTVVHIRALKKTAEITVYSDDINGYYGGSISYYDNEKGKDVNAGISDNAVILYNGRSVAGMNEGYIPENGKIRLISTDGSSDYDVVIIFEYQSFVVESVFQGEVSFKYGCKFTDENGNAQQTVDLSSDNAIIERDGRSISYSLISDNDAISIAYSGDTYYVTISQETVKGIIRSVTHDSTKCYINGKNYGVNKKFEELAKSGVSGLKEISGGLNATFYIDAANKIVGMDVSKSDMRYGYLRSVDIDENTAVIYDNAEMDFVKYTLDEKCILNGVRISSLEMLTEALQDFIRSCRNKTEYDSNNNLTKFVPPIMKFKTNPDRNITAISTDQYNIAGKNAEPGEGEISREAPISNNYLTVSPYSSKIWQTTDRLFTSFNSDVGIIRVKGGQAMKVPVNENMSDFETSNAAQSFLPNTDNKGINVILYDIDFETGVPGYIVYVEDAGGANVEIKSELYGVVSVGEADDDGSECAMLTLYSSLTGAKDRYYTSDNEDVVQYCKDLKKGDIVQLKQNYKGKITGVTKVMSYSKENYERSAYTEAGGEQYVRMRDGRGMFLASYIGSKYVKQGNIGSIVKLGTADTRMGTSYSAVQITGKGLVYDGKDFYMGDIGNASGGDMIFGISYVGGSESYIIFKYDVPEYTEADMFYIER